MEPGQEVGFTNTIDAQALSDKLMRAFHVVETNIETLAQLLDEAKCIHNLEREDLKDEALANLDERYRVLERLVNSKIRSWSFARKNIKSLCDRFSGISEMASRRSRVPKGVHVLMKSR